MRRAKLLLPSALTLASSFSAMADKPNILWIITDDQRPDAIEAYNRATTGKSESALGYVSSPNTDRLAEEGVLFTHAYCNSPMSTPSRASMHSGRYPFRTGHYKFTSNQTAGHTRPTTSQTLREYGYGTAMFGKTGWGIRSTKGDKPFFDYMVEINQAIKNNGFGNMVKGKYGSKYTFVDGVLQVIYSSECVQLPNGQTIEYYIQREDGNISEEDKATRAKYEKDFDILRAYTRINKCLILGGENTQPAEKMCDSYLTREFENYLKNQDASFKTLGGKDAQGADSKRPLFVNLSYTWPHTPVLPPKEIRDKFKKKKYNIPSFSTDELSNFPPQLVMLYNECKTDQFTDKEKLQAIQDYYAFCAYGDELIGQSVEAFKEYCKKNNQEYLIVFTIGDHGWHLGEQGIMAKFGPWRNSIQNATIVVSSDKSKYPASSVNNDIVEYVDFAATILAGAGVDIKDAKYDYLDGTDLAEVIADPKGTHRDYTIGELNVVCGHRAFMRSKEFAFSMRSRDRWEESKADNINYDVKWALNCDRPKAEMALYDLRVDPSERVNLADDNRYRALADWFRVKLGTIVLGDGRVEADWSKPNCYSLSNFAAGADNKKLDIPKNLIPEI